MNNLQPISLTIAEYTSGDYYVTAASWQNIYGTSYEIGIRTKSDGKFIILQSDWNHQTVQEVANAIAHIQDAGESNTPEWCKEHFT
jgi:hypothetical protein